MDGVEQRQRFILGVDGGNSKTLAVVGDSTGRIVGAARAGGGNHQNKGLQGAMNNIRAAAEGALSSAQVGPTGIEAAYFALAGADLPEDFDLLLPACRQLGYGREVGLNNDSAASLRSGSDNPNAVVVGWGSGVNALGRNAAGREIRLPALGDISGDWGGGGDLAREAIRLVARAHDGRGQATMLTELVLETLRVADPDEMIRKLYFKQADEAAILAIPPLVFRAANRGDVVARDLVLRAADEIAVTAVALLRRLDLIETHADVVLAGSVFRAEGTLLIDSVSAELGSTAPLARVVRPDVEPVVGAFFAGFDLLDIPVDERMRARARASCAETVRPHAEMRR